MGTQSIVSGMLLILTLSGCESGDIQIPGEPKYPTLTPVQLRNIPISDLSVEISIDDNTITYQGTDFPDGVWQIDYDLESNQNYDIVLKWFALTHLVLAENGQIFTDPDLQTITPELEFISAGLDRFDDDCDGQSNLDEILNGTNPGGDGATTETACTNNAENIVLPENVYPWIIRQHKVFPLDGITSRVTRYEQAIQITATNPNLTTNFGMSLRTDPNTGINVVARVDFRSDASKGKQLRFEISEADNFQLPTIANAECSEYENAGIECLIPYEWQEQQWYIVSIEEASETSWKASVRDDTSGISQDIATIETQSTLDWYRSQNVLSYRQQIPSEQCSLGLVPVSMRYKLGLTNTTPVLRSEKIVSGPCVKAGGGWSEGIRTIDNALVYSLTLGRSD